MIRTFRIFVLIAVVAAASVLLVSAQNGSGKRNERPKTPDTEKPALKPVSAPTHSYEFTRPGFTYGRIAIEHDDTGVGTISFVRDGNDEAYTDPIKLSAPTLRKISAALTELNFLDSTEEYQFPKDFSHMGNVSFTLRSGTRTRTVKYNWTENEAAKALMDEYRRIGNEYTWKFEMVLARQNMPLQTPSLMEAFDSYYRRGEISDPASVVPFLSELSNDERLPLIARNKASKIIKDIGKGR